MLIPYCLYCACMSLVSFFAYGLDKRKAKNGKWRISEAVLLLLGVLGGALGAFLGMKLFHHKTKRWYFWTVNLFALVLQIVIGARCR